MMSSDRVEDIFELVFQCLESAIDHLSDWTPRRRGERRGLERWFQHEIVTPTLKTRGYEIKAYGRGVDLLIRRADSELLLEIKAANDFRVNYVVGVEGDGWITKYMEQERLLRFAGCLFLGCESNETINARLTELDETLKNPERMRGHDITLVQHEELATSDGEFCWILGLLVTPYGRTLLTRKDKYSDANAL
jgi:hypothetical protein